MLALALRYLQGIAVGSHGEHARVEWPPHPARVFMAMVAAHHQTDARPEERAALLWLEALPQPPDIFAPEAAPCQTVTQFVPVNDKAGPSKSLIHTLPLTRDRQPRTFARASLASDTVVFHWPEVEPTPDVRAALESLCGKVTRVGHSTSLVQMWLADAVPDGLQHWRVDEARATHMLRVPREGTLERVLEPTFNGEAVARYVAMLLAVEEAPTPKARTAAKKKARRHVPARRATTASSAHFDLCRLCALRRRDRCASRKGQRLQPASCGLRAGTKRRTVSASRPCLHPGAHRPLARSPHETRGGNGSQPGSLERADRALAGQLAAANRTRCLPSARFCEPSAR